MNNLDRKFDRYSIYQLQRIVIQNQKDNDVLNDILIELYLRRNNNELDLSLMKDIKKHININKKIKEIYLDNYIPKNRGDQNKFSEEILKFKNANINSINYFAKQIFKRWKYINDHKFTLCKVPSSDANKTKNSISDLISILIMNSTQNHRDASEFIIRKHSIQPQHKSYGNERLTIKGHLDSLDVDNNKLELVDGKNVILFDDVVTTGNSMRSCTFLLFKNNAQKVIQFSLSKTKKRNESL